MKVIKLGLSAIVTKKEYDEKVGTEYPTLYVVDTDNFAFYKRSNLAEGGSCLLKIQELPKMDVDGNVQEEISFLPGGKIPGNMLNQIVSFFRKVMDVNFGGANSRAGENCEAMAHILWHRKDKCYQVGIPTQRVSKASVNYDFDDINQEDHVIIIDIHSHNTMGAFFSGTDDGDDKKGLWFAGVVGNLDKPSPNLKWRFTHYGNFREVKMEDLFDLPDGIKSDLEVSPEWMAKVQGRWESPKTVYSGQGHPGGSWRQNDFGFAGGNLAHLYKDRQRSPGANPAMGGSDDEADWRQAFADYEKRQARSLRFNKSDGWQKKGPVRDVNDDDYSTRVLLDVTDGIEEFSFPIHHEELKKTAECLRDQVSSGISRLAKKNGIFYLILAEYFLEAFSEEHEGDVGARTNAAYLIECILEHADWDVISDAHKAVMDKIETYYEEGEDTNLLITYMEEKEEELLPDQVHRLRELIENAKVCSNETGD